MAKRRSSTTSDNLQQNFGFNKHYTFQFLMEKFCRNMVLRGLSENTIRSYTHELEMFERFLIMHDVDIDVLSDITPDVINDFIEYQLLDKKLQKSSINVKVKVLKSFYGYAEKTYNIANPMKHINHMKVQEKVLYTPNQDDVKLLLDACDLTKFKDLRIYTTIMLFTNSGMRLNEVTRLELSNIDFINKSITVHKTKNGKVRQVPINDKLLKTLRLYIAERGELDHDVLFVNMLNEPINKRTIQENVHDLAVSVGLGDFDIHCMRRFFVSTLVAKNVPIPVITSIIGHSNLSSLMRYVYSNETDKHKAVQKL